MPDSYNIVTQWSPEDRVFISRVPQRPGLAVYGSTIDEAETKAMILVKDWHDSGAKMAIRLANRRSRML